MASSFLRLDVAAPAKIVTGNESDLDFCRKESIRGPFVDSSFVGTMSVNERIQSPQGEEASRQLDVDGAIAAFRRLWHLSSTTAQEELRQTTVDALEILLTQLSKIVISGVDDGDDDGENPRVDRNGLERVLFLVAVHPAFDGE